MNDNNCIDFLVLRFRKKDFYNEKNETTRSSERFGTFGFMVDSARLENILNMPHVSDRRFK